MNSEMNIKFKQVSVVAQKQRTRCIDKAGRLDVQTKINKKMNK